MKIVCIIQARISSTRLPAKILLPGYNKPLLFHLIDRINKCKQINKVVVATSKNSLDDLLYDLCLSKKINVFRGSLDDLLDRYFKCAKKFKADHIVRITSDCPLIDPKIIDSVIKKYLSVKNLDYMSNIHPPSYPDGFDVEIFSFKALRKAHVTAKNNFEREHVTPYIWDNLDKFKIKNYSNLKNKNLYENYRLTLDYKEDFFVIWKIFQKLYPKKKNFNLKDIISFLKRNPKIMKNNHLIKVNWYKNYYKKLKTINKRDVRTKVINV
tara:strand:- start:79807 stop:80610 length:804 start_codon:yes stop_codon:yes gene_type:complete